MTGPGTSRVRHGRRCSDGDEGFAALELALFAPFFIAMLMLVVGLGRASHGRQLIDQSGAAAARAASLDNTPSRAAIDARRAAGDTLTQAGMSCENLQVAVDTSRFRPGGAVNVTVRCTVDLSRLALAGLPGSVTLSSSSTSPLENFRDFR